MPAAVKGPRRCWSNWRQFSDLSCDERGVSRSSTDASRGAFGTFAPAITAVRPGPNPRGATIVVQVPYMR